MSRKQPINTCLKVMLHTLLMSLWGVAGTADTMPPQINMNTGMAQYEPGVVKAMVMDNTDVSKVTLYYREQGKSYYNSIEMKRENDIYYRKLNREFGVDGMVEYYILAQDNSGNQSSEPTMNPQENPMTAAMSADVNQSVPEVNLSNPLPGTVLETGDESIMITFYNTGREIDFNTVRFKIDKRDRTREAEFIGNVLIWEPRRALSDGFHEIEIVVKDTDGDYIGPNIW
ncbi:hypothetical protein ACFL1R_13430, partial [Candidatus Latescibacterota bacterium]